MSYALTDIVIVIGERAITLGEVLMAAGAVALLLLMLLTISQWRAASRQALEAAASAERAREFDDKVGELNKFQAELTGRMQTMAEIFGTRQSDMVRLLAERMDGLRSQLGQGIEAGAKSTGETLGKLHERLAVIDAAQANLSGLTQEVLTLKDVLANKQARGAYGQGRMEAILRDGLPQGAYEFQPMLSNKTRPDCLVSLPGDSRKLVIDAKFPLEGFTALKGAASDPERKQAMQQVRTDIGLHVKAISDKYLIPGETQDMALMFVPSEALYADLHEHFDDVMQRAHKARVLVVSPTLLSMAVQLMQAIVRDSRMREEARVIQSEVGKLLDDVRRLGERVEKLDTHFRQASEDVSAIKTSSDKVTKRGERIGALEFDDRPQLAAAPEPPRAFRIVD
ncbi:MAG: DNA recombination protein RmuC [Bosea sp. (in: a-proteobacteria)]